MRIERSDLQVWEDKVKQEVLFFKEEDAPAAITFVCDISGSMSTKLAALRKAVQRFGESSHPSDEYGLVTFRETAFNLGENLEYNDIVNRLALIRPQGKTAFFDGILEGIAALKRSKLPRKVIVLVSDGMDNASRGTYRQIKEQLKESDIRLFAIGCIDRNLLALQANVGPSNQLPSIPLEAEGAETLETLANLANGLFLLADSERDLTVAAEIIALELRKSFMVAYATTNETESAKRSWRKIKIKCTKPGVRVIYRPGYYAQ